jgi:hypothetical protein
MHGIAEEFYAQKPQSLRVNGVEILGDQSHMRNEIDCDDKTTIVLLFLKRFRHQESWFL